MIETAMLQNDGHDNYAATYLPISVAAAFRLADFALHRWNLLVLFLHRSVCRIHSKGGAPDIIHATHIEYESHMGSGRRAKS